MAHLHAITERGSGLSATLREQQGEPSFRNPARRAAFMVAQRVADDAQWHHSSANAADFLRAFACIANKMAGSSGVHPALRRQLQMTARQERF